MIGVRCGEEIVNRDDRPASCIFLLGPVPGARIHNFFFGHGVVFTAGEHIGAARIEPRAAAHQRTRCNFQFILHVTHGSGDGIRFQKKVANFSQEIVQVIRLQQIRQSGFFQNWLGLRGDSRGHQK
jgi:hypothetical protein